MSLDSFYGGKQGVSPVVKARFKYIDTNDLAYKAAITSGIDEADLKDDTMELCFQNPEYTQVWYGQLCIIDTTNKRNPNNGKLFRRVLPRAKSVYEKDGGTPNAEYIGRIIGPSEGYPTVRFGSLEQMVQMAQEEYDGDVDIVYPINDNGDIIKEYVDASYIALDRKHDGDYSEENPNKKIRVLKATQTEGNLIPGAIEPEKEGDEWYYEKGINYSWVNIRSNVEGVDQDTFVYLGFEIPYTIFDFQISDINWYENAEQELLNKKQYLNGEQPFFQHWKISIPRGQPGHFASNLRRTKSNEFRNWDPENANKPILYDFKDIEILDDGKYLIPSYSIYPTTFNGIKIQEDAAIVVYTYHFFSRNEEDDLPHEETINCYLGQIRDLSEIVLDEHGLVTVKYTDKTSTVLNEDHPLKWIESIVFHPKGENKEEPDNWGYITVTYNTVDPDNPEDPESGIHSHETTNFYLHLIDKVRTTVPKNSDHGIVEIKYKDQEEGEWEPVEDFSYRFVDDFKVEKDSKELKYHTNPNINGFMSFADPVYLNAIEETYVGLDGNLYVRYSSSEYRVDPNESEYADEQFIDPIEQNPPLYIYFDEKGREWRKGGFLPDANDEEPVWWLNLGNIVKYDAHVKIVQELQWDRFAKIHGYASAEEMDPEQFSREDILRILNSSEIDITLSDKYKWIYNGIDYNPYVNGHILAFPPPSGDEDEDLIPNERYSEDFKGQLVFANHMAFYYDYNIGRWKYAGPWGGDPDKAPAKVIAEDKEKPFVPGIDEEVKIDLNYYGFYFGALGDKEQISELNDLGLIYEDKNTAGGGG